MRPFLLKEMGGSPIPKCVLGAVVPFVGRLPDPCAGEAAAPAKSPLAGEAMEGTAAKWPWKLAACHVHFLKKDGSKHFLCWRGQAAKSVDHMDGGDDIMAALTGGRPACKRCLRALPASIRGEVLSLSDAAGL